MTNFLENSCSTYVMFCAVFSFTASVWVKNLYFVIYVHVPFIVTSTQHYTTSTYQCSVEVWSLTIPVPTSVVLKSGL